VYRAIKTMADEGRVVGVTLPGEHTRYEVSGRGHHHHFQCRECHKVFELEGCSGEFGTIAPPGFKLDAHEVVMYGRCDLCATAAS
jgi:Fur family ferric uptake transcriptional regulator